jgi:hypothetical protein
MRRAYSFLAALPLLTGAALTPGLVSAQSANCPVGYTVAFFNGVGNTYGAAVVSMHATQKAIQASQHTTDDVYDSEDVQYEVMYNTTASQQPSITDLTNTTIIQDIAEVFVQRAKELDPSGTVGNNFFYMFWEWYDGPPQNYSNALGNNPLTNNFMARFVNAAVTTAVGALSKLYSSQAPTAEDYAQQEAQLTADANAGRKLLLVAHSQGNLFVTHGYDFILPAVSAARVKVVHAAPASVTLRGNYVLSAKDVIINSLRLINGFASIVDPNINPPYYNVDQTGHGYTEIYLSGTLIDSFSQMSDQAILQQEFSAALVALDAQQCMASISPASSTVGAGGNVTLNAALSPPLNAANVDAIVYKWAIAGTAGGTFTNPVYGTQVSSLTTATPTVTYNASSAAADGQSDSVTVEVDVSTANNNNATTKALAATTKNPALITIGGVKATLAPNNPTVAPGSDTTFTVTVQGTLPAGATYQWTLSGVGSIGAASPVVTTAPTIVYTAPIQGSPATLSVSVLDAKGNTVGSGTTAITITNPWVGIWVGNTVSTCGYYSGPQTFDITVVNATTLNFGPYTATYSGNSASVNNGAVVFTLSGNTITGYEADSCQSGTYTRQ